MPRRGRWRTGFSRRGARGVAVTRGARGSSAFLPDGEAEQPALAGRSARHDRGGDAYIAGFLMARLAGAGVAEAAAAGARVAARCCCIPAASRSSPREGMCCAGASRAP